MLNLDIKKWKTFKINQILTREKIKSISSVKRQFNSGEINVIGNSRQNNGVIEKLNISNNIYIHRKNTLSYGAKGGYFYWQDEKWASTDHVHLFSSPFLNKYNSLFLCAILNNLVDYYGGWNSSLESNIIDFDIKLPVTNK